MNINNKEFNHNFSQWINIPESTSASDRLFSKFLYKDMLTIISNALYEFDFTKYQIKYEDAEAELIMHFFINRKKFKAYSGNYYNILFTLFRNRLYDLCRVQVTREKRELMLISVREVHPQLLEEETDNE